MTESTEHANRHFGVRDLLGAVNLLDFAHMVTAELTMLGTSTRIAFDKLRTPPFGPVVFAAGMLMVFVRLALLVLVVVCFGGAILVITIVRGISKVMRRRPRDGTPSDDGE